MDSIKSQSHFSLMQFQTVWNRFETEKCGFSRADRMNYSKSHSRSQISLIFSYNFETDLRLKELIR